MSYIVPSELPKSCSCCPFCHLIMQNPLSSKTPIKRYRCQVREAPWRTFDVDFYNCDGYKDKDCPLVPMQEIVERLEDYRMWKDFMIYDLTYREREIIKKVIEIVKAGGTYEHD